MKTIDNVIQKLEYIMEGDPRTFSNPECEYEWVFHRVNEAIKMLKEIEKDSPSAQTEQRWIPCSETVDIPDHEVLACDKYGAEILGYLEYEYTAKQWICVSKDCIMYDPIAWMEKPKPYTERKQK